MRETWFACLLVIGATGCPDIQTDPGEGSDLPTSDGPTVEFDPANAILPFPNNLATAAGKVSLPPQPCEAPAATAIREGILNHLDGFGTFESALQVTFTEAVDPASLDGNILIYKRADGATAVDPAGAEPLEVITIPGTTFRFDAANCSAPAVIDAVTIVPKLPMDQRSTYIAVLKSGIKTATGTAFVPSTTWGLVRNGNEPVTLDDQGNVIANRTPLNPQDPAQLAQLQGLDLLWKAHAQGLGFVEQVGAVKRGDLLVGFEFTTQTITDPLDPTVAGTPAATLPTDPFDGTQSILGGAMPAQFLKSVLGAGVCDIDAGPLPCSDVGDIVAGNISSPNYQLPLPNPMAGGNPIPGPWTDSAHPTQMGSTGIQAFIALPKAVAPATGYPTMVFGHGLTRRKEDMFAIVSQLAHLGVATVAIDFVASGGRAVRISTDAAVGCDGTRDPTKGPDVHCFSPILSTNLAGTRDNIRQTALDVQALVEVLKACGTANCGPVSIDATKLMYGGQSLGGIIGSVITGSSTSFKAALLNVPAVGLLDVLENTASLGIRCSLVDGLIDAGVLVGDKSNLLAMPPTGLCTTDAWKTQPGYLQFSAIGRWVLDPADGANYTKKLDTRRILIQEVVDDQTVPNVATDTLGGLTVGIPTGNADCNGGASPLPPSAAITTDTLTSKWVRYPTTDTTACPQFGNSYQHGSWLAPVSAGNPPVPTIAGQLGTARMQTDAFFWLLTNAETP